MKCIEDEIPFDVPEGWEWCRLLPLTIKIGAGSTPTGGATVYSTSGIKFIRSQNVYDVGLVLNDVAYISEEINQKKSGSIVKPKDILLNITGGSIGRCSLVPDDFDIANVNQHVNKKLIDTKFAFYAMQCIQCDCYNHKRYWISDFSNKLIPLPPLGEQLNIVHTIEKLYSCIEKSLN